MRDFSTLRQSHRIIFIISVILSISAFGSASGQDLIVKVGNVLAPANQTGIPIPIYMQNQSDTVAGFEVWMAMNNPDRAIFQTYPDSANLVVLETSGTLISGWQHIQAHTFGNYDANIVGLANLAGLPFVEGILPKSGDTPLIKVMVDTYPIEDTVTDNSVDLMLMHDMIDQFCFSDPSGNPIGVVYDSILDVVCYDCVAWAPPPNDTLCLMWQKVSGTEGDSCGLEWVLNAYIDTNVIEIIDGSLEIFICGDVNGDNTFNIFDVVELIRCLYGGLPDPPPVCPAYIADVNLDQTLNIFDITYMINCLYKGGPEPICGYIWVD